MVNGGTQRRKRQADGREWCSRNKHWVPPSAFGQETSLTCLPCRRKCAEYHDRRSRNARRMSVANAIAAAAGIDTAAVPSSPVIPQRLDAAARRRQRATPRANSQSAAPSSIASLMLPTRKHTEDAAPLAPPQLLDCVPAPDTLASIADNESVQAELLPLDIRLPYLSTDLTKPSSSYDDVKVPIADCASTMLSCSDDEHGLPGMTSVTIEIDDEDIAPLSGFLTTRLASTWVPLISSSSSFLFSCAKVNCPANVSIEPQVGNQSALVVVDDSHNHTCFSILPIIQTWIAGKSSRLQAPTPPPSLSSMLPDESPTPSSSAAASSSSSAAASTSALASTSPSATAPFLLDDCGMASTKVQPAFSDPMVEQMILSWID